MEDLYGKTYIKPWFIEQMKELVEVEERILACKGKELPDALLMQAKKEAEWTGDHCSAPSVMKRMHGPFIFGLMYSP